jgi:hypothetical protein
VEGTVMGEMVGVALDAKKRKVWTGVRMDEQQESELDKSKPYLK